MTLNGVMAKCLRYSTEFGSFGANYVKVVEDRPILSAKNLAEKSSFSNIYLWQYLQRCLVSRMSLNGVMTTDPRYLCCS